MTSFAPYIYAWGKGNKEHYKVSCIDDVVNETGITELTLAFLVHGRYNEVSAWASDIKKFQGKVILSIGGASGIYPAENTMDDMETNRLVDLLYECGFSGLDLDIEGESLENRKRMKRLRTIVKGVSEAMGPDFYISLTFPVLFSGGLRWESLEILKAFQADNIHVSSVNSMIMDFCTPLPQGSSWGAEDTRILTEVHNQLCQIYSDKSGDQIWGMMGVCPMIGRNDDKSVFTVDDWKLILEFAVKKKMKMTSFWALNRDQVCPSGDGNLGEFSFAQEKDLEYTNAALGIL